VGSCHGLAQSVVLLSFRGWAWQETFDTSHAKPEAGFQLTGPRVLRRPSLVWTDGSVTNLHRQPKKASALVVPGTSHANAPSSARCCAWGLDAGMTGPLAARCVHVALGRVDLEPGCASPDVKAIAGPRTAAHIADASRLALRARYTRLPVAGSALFHWKCIKVWCEAPKERQPHRGPAIGGKFIPPGKQRASLAVRGPVSLRASKKFSRRSPSESLGNLTASRPSLLHFVRSEPLCPTSTRTPRLHFFSFSPSASTIPVPRNWLNLQNPHPGNRAHPTAGRRNGASRSAPARGDRSRLVSLSSPPPIIARPVPAFVTTAGITLTGVRTSHAASRRQAGCFAVEARPPRPTKCSCHQGTPAREARAHPGKTLLRPGASHDAQIWVGGLWAADFSRSPSTPPRGPCSRESRSVSPRNWVGPMDASADCSHAPPFFPSELEASIGRA